MVFLQHLKREKMLKFILVYWIIFVHSFILLRQTGFSLKLTFCRSFMRVCVLFI